MLSEKNGRSIESVCPARRVRKKLAGLGGRAGPSRSKHRPNAGDHERPLQIFRGLLGTGGQEIGLRRCGLSPVPLSVLVLLATMEWAVPVQVCRPFNGDSASYLCWSGFLLGPRDQNLGGGGGTLSPVSKESTVERKLSSVAVHGCFVFFSKPWLVNCVDGPSGALALEQFPV